MALFIFSSHKKGISSHQLGRDIGVTQKSAWFMLHRLRYAFDHPNFKEITGDNIVEIDETYMGGEYKNTHTDKKLKDALHEATVAAEDRITAATERAEAATERAEAAEELAQKAQSQATRLGVLHDALVDHVEALWEWIEAAATPPAPVNPSVLKPYLQLPRLSRTTEPSP